MESNASIGARGEQIAVAYLRKNGFLIREKNWRNGRYEIDIIAEKWGVIHFVEVKTRKAGGWTTPEQAITKDKFRALHHAATAYIAFNAIRQEERQFDLIAIDMDGDTPSDIRFIENAMQYSW